MIHFILLRRYILYYLNMMFLSSYIINYILYFQHPSFLFDCTVLSLSSAVGQLFIYFTIAIYGPVIFTIIMTIRQALAVLLSCLIYDHAISFIGAIGIIILFLAIFLRVYCNQRLRAIKKQALKESGRPLIRV